MPLTFDLEAVKAKNLHPTSHIAIGLNIEINAANPTLRAQAEKARDAKFEIINAYLQNFVFIKGGLCPGCDKPLGGPGGTFAWADAQQPATAGEGSCKECRYPARAHHFIDEVIVLKHFVLAYHPSVIRIREVEAPPTT